MFTVKMPKYIECTKTQKPKKHKKGKIELKIKNTSIV
jgi:hypothetical protein